jgi:hypothetical protein
MNIRDILYLLGIFLFFSCAKVVRQDTNEWEESRSIVVESIEKTGDCFDNHCTFKGKTYVAQGVAICGSILYRLYESGLCETYNIDNIRQPRKVATFELGSRNLLNHSNCAQIMLPGNGDTLIYVAGLRGKCYVERISSNHSELLQTIPCLHWICFTIRRI